MVMAVMEVRLIKRGASLIKRTKSQKMCKIIAGAEFYIGLRQNLPLQIRKAECCRLFGVAYQTPVFISSLYIRNAGQPVALPTRHCFWFPRALDSAQFRHRVGRFRLIQDVAGRPILHTHTLVNVQCSRKLQECNTRCPSHTQHTYSRLALPFLSQGGISKGPTPSSKVLALPGTRIGCLLCCSCLLFCSLLC